MEKLWDAYGSHVEPSCLTQLNMKGGNLEVSVFLACIYFLINFYSGFLVIRGILAHFFALILLSVALFVILWRYHIPRPKEIIIRNFFGGDWGAYASYKEVDECGFLLKVIAHRACGLDTPENSLSALKAVHKEGIKAVEFDVRLTLDGVPVVFHDYNLLRMTDVNRNVAETSYEEIKELDISVNHPFGKNFPNEKIPTLQEFVKYCLENELRMFIDLKTTNEKTAKIINDLYKQYPKMYDLSLISSFNPFIIHKIRSRDSNIICCLAWRPYYFSHKEYNIVDGPTEPRTSNFFLLLLYRMRNVIYEWALQTFLYYLIGISGILIQKDLVNRKMIDYWNNRGVRVIAWNVNLPSEKQYFENILGITYLTDTAINS